MTPTAETGLIALLGDPVAHSVSPAIHTAGFRAHGLDLAYLACRVAPDELDAAIAGLWALGAVGANVTAPHKEAVVALCASVSDAVRETGAANTLVRTDAGWHAENTDVAGFLAPLAGLPLTDGAAVVLGAGGAARAAAYALLSRARPRTLTVVARRQAPAEALVASLESPDDDGVLQVRAFDEAAEAVRHAVLVVNATPVGTDDPDATPWPHAEDFHAGQTVYDLVYRPTETRLMREARAAGAETIGGLPMLVAQAAASFQLWTDRDLPLAAARDAAERALAAPTSRFAP